MTQALWWLVLAAPLAWGLGALLVLVLPRGNLRLWLIALCSGSGSLALAAAGVIALTASSHPPQVALGSWPGLGSASLRVDALSGYFMGITGLVGAVLFFARPGILSHARGRSPITSLAMLLASLELVFVADNGFLFLIGWEGLAMAFFFLVGGGYRRSFEAPAAAYWTLSMAKLGGAAVLVAFLLLGANAGSLDFGAMLHAHALPAGLATAVLACALAGFGVKIGAIPVQSWLPRAYPAAPLGAPAFLAAIGLDGGFYGLLRVLQLLGTGPLWWGSVVVLLGAVTAFGGILYAAVQTDLKALISYSSIENAGIILCGIGAAMIGRSAHLPLLFGLGLVAALYQITMHTVAKAGLFVCADAIERHSGTTDMERLGGLARSMRFVAGAFALLAATIIALPPTGGFPSEWLTLETLMQGFRARTLLPEISIAVAGTLLALTAAVAGIAFVKAFSSTFLGFARAPRPAIHVGLSSVCGAIVLGLGGLGLGIVAPWITFPIAQAASALGAPDVGKGVSTGNLLISPAFPDFSSIAPTEVAIVLVGFLSLLLVLGALVRNRAATIRRTPVWSSGAIPAQARTQYTPTGWSNPTRVVFDALLRTRRSRAVSGPKLAPVEVRYSSRVPAVVDDRLVLPLAGLVSRMAGRLQVIQSGRLGDYVLYILVVVVTILLVVPLIR
jgi:formate hydrogenlyase subunit 3/multisubunit Na+/H+ antiporter MnhD subunit